MAHESVSVGKSVSCEGCVGNTIGNREVCKSLPRCFTTDQRGNMFNVVFAKNTAMSEALKGAK